MGADTGRSPRLTRAGLAGHLLPAVLLALATLQAAQPLHVHRAATAGLYNEQHVLDALGALGGDVPLADRLTAPPGDAIAERCATAAGSRFFAPVPRHADCRAPPLA